jgi:hypothetical protein
MKKALYIAINAICFMISALIILLVTASVCIYFKSMAGIAVTPVVAVTSFLILGKINDYAFDKLNISQGDNT